MLARRDLPLTTTAHDLRSKSHIQFGSLRICLDALWRGAGVDVAELLVD